MDGFRFLFSAPLYYKYLARYVVFSSNIYNYIMLTASLEDLQFEFVQSFPVVYVLHLSDFICKRSLNNFDCWYAFCIPWIPEQKTVL